MNRVFNAILLVAAVAGIAATVFTWGFASDEQRHQLLSLCWIRSCNPEAAASRQDALVDNSHWSHNGSVMYLRTAGSARRIYYLQPRPGMLDAGAAPDSLLFDGTDDNGHWSGSARVFNKRCGRQYPYLVEGGPRAGNTIIELTGRAPRVGADCAITGYGGSNDDLIFSVIRN